MKIFLLISCFIICSCSPINRESRESTTAFTKDGKAIQVYFSYYGNWQDFRRIAEAYSKFAYQYTFDELMNGKNQEFKSDIKDFSIQTPQPILYKGR